MYGETNLNYHLNVEAPWKQYLERDVFNPAEATKLLYDVDTQIGNKAAAYMVFEHRLRVLPDMPRTLEDCAPLVQQLKRIGQTGTAWKDTAFMLRQMAKNKADVAIGYLQNEVARLETICAGAPELREGRQAQAEAPLQEEAPQADNEERVRARAELATLKIKLKEAEADGIKATWRLSENLFTAEETRYAKELTGEQAEVVEREPRVWEQVVRKILTTLLHCLEVFLSKLREQ